MSDLVGRHDALLLGGEDGVLLLVARDDHLDGFLQVGLGRALAAVAHRPQRRLVDDVGKLRAGCAGCHARHAVEVHRALQPDLLGVHLQNFLAALQVGQLHGHAAVKASRTGQRRVEGLRTIRRRQDDHAVVALEAVHLGQQLVQRLLALVVAAHLTVALLADGVDLVDEHDAGGLLLRLLEQIAHLACAHAHEHLHKFGAGHGEEGHVGLARHGLGQHGLAGAGRADQQQTLGHLRADLFIFLGVVQVVHDLGKVLLGLVLAGHVGELDAVGGLHVDLGVALAHVEHHGVCAACGLGQLAGQQLAQQHEDQNRSDPAHKEAQQRRHLLDDLAGELRAGGVQPLGAVGIVHQAGLVDLALLVGEQDAVGLNLHLIDLLFVGHGDEGAVVHLLNLHLADVGHQQGVEQKQRQHDDQIVEYQRLFRRFDGIHAQFSPFISSLAAHSIPHI